MLREGHGGHYKALTKEERKARKAKRRERSDQVYCSLRFVRYSSWMRQCNLERMLVIRASGGPDTPQSNGNNLMERSAVIQFK